MRSHIPIDMPCVIQATLGQPLGWPPSFHRLPMGTNVFRGSVKVAICLPGLEDQRTRGRAFSYFGTKAELCCVGYITHTNRSSNSSNRQRAHESLWRRAPLRLCAEKTNPWHVFGRVSHSRPRSGSGASRLHRRLHHPAWWSPCPAVAPPSRDAVRIAEELGTCPECSAALCPS